MGEIITVPARSFIRARLFEDTNGFLWIARSEEKLRQDERDDLLDDEVCWPVRELEDSELDQREIDCTSPDVDIYAEDFKPDLMTLRTFAKDFDGLVLSQLVCTGDYE